MTRIALPLLLVASLALGGCAASIAAGVVGQLPLAVAGRADLQQQRMIGCQRQVLAYAPV